MNPPARTPGGVVLPRPFLPPPLETLSLDGAEDTQRRLELRRSYESGYQAGHADGQAEGMAEGKRLALAAAAQQVEAGARDAAARSQREGVAVLNAALAELAAHHAEAAAERERAVRDALAAALRHLAPRLADAAMPGELAALVTEALTRRGRDLVTLRAHPETLAQLPPGAAPEMLRLEPDATMRKHTAEASWVSGGLVLDAEALADRVLAVLVPPAPATPQTEPAPSPMQEKPA
jgi:hypothetical protein